MQSTRQALSINLTQASLDDLISNFKSALSGRSVDVIKAMWDGNPLLQAWYSGQQVNFGNNHLGQPDMRAISLDDLISNFKSALSSHCKELIKAMWDGNERLHHAIQDLSFDTSKKLLQKVMHSSKTGKSEFITEYVTWFNQADVITAVFDDITKSLKGKKPSAYKKNQMDILEKRLEKLKSDENALRDVVVGAPENHRAPTNTDVQYNTQSDLPELNGQSLQLPDDNDYYTATATQPIQTYVAGYRQWNLFSGNNGSDKKRQRPEENASLDMQQRQAHSYTLSDSLELLPPPAKRTKLGDSQEEDIQNTGIENQVPASNGDDDMFMEFFNPSYS